MILSFAVGRSFSLKSNGFNTNSIFQVVEVNKKVVWSGLAFGAFAIHPWYFSKHNGITTIRVEESMEGWLVTLFKTKFQSNPDSSTNNWLRYLRLANENTTVD